MREGETQELCEKRGSRPELLVSGGFVVFGSGLGTMLWGSCEWIFANCSTLFSSKEVCPVRAFSCGSIIVCGCFILQYIENIDFLPDFPLMDSIIGAFHWLFPWNF